jgi:hypothetical protein
VIGIGPHRYAPGDHYITLLSFSLASEVADVYSSQWFSNASFAVEGYASIPSNAPVRIELLIPTGRYGSRRRLLEKMRSLVEEAVMADGASAAIPPRGNGRGLREDELSLSICAGRIMVIGAGVGPRQIHLHTINPSRGLAKTLETDAWGEWKGREDEYLDSIIDTQFPLSICCAACDTALSPNDTKHVGCHRDVEMVGRVALEGGMHGTQEELMRVKRWKRVNLASYGREEAAMEVELLNEFGDSVTLGEGTMRVEVEVGRWRDL